MNVVVVVAGVGVVNVVVSDVVTIDFGVIDVGKVKVSLCISEIGPVVALVSLKVDIIGVLVEVLV